MSLKKVRIFPITGYGSDGYPTYGSPISLVTVDSGETEVNNIRVKIAKTLKEKTLNADDREKKTRAIVGYTGEIEAYGVDANAISNLFPATKDSRGNIIHQAGSLVGKKVGVFFEGKNEAGKVYQKWLYEVEFKPFDEEDKTEGDNAESIVLEFDGHVINVTTLGDITHATVYSGSTGFVSGEPTASDIYKYVATPPNSGSGQ